MFGRHLHHEPGGLLRRLVVDGEVMRAVRLALLVHVAIRTAHPEPGREAAHRGDRSCSDVLRKHLQMLELVRDLCRRARRPRHQRHEDQARDAQPRARPAPMESCLSSRLRSHRSLLDEVDRESVLGFAMCTTWRGPQGPGASAKVAPSTARGQRIARVWDQPSGAWDQSSARVSFQRRMASASVRSCS